MRTPRSRPQRVVPVVLATLALLVTACATPGTDPGPADEDPTAADPAASDPVGTDDGDDATGAEVSDPAGTAPELTVVATTSILGDIVSTLAGDDAEVHVLMPPGVDPHGFQPSAADAALLRRADLVVANGLTLEEGLVSALDAAAADGARVFTLADKLDPIGFTEGAPVHDDNGDDDHDDHGHDDDGHDDHDHGPEDPHVWFDPVRMADGVRLLAAELAAVSTRVDAVEWEARGDAYAAELLEVHAELEARFAEIPDERRRLVTNHDALGYLAHRYGLEVIGTVVPGATTQAETDPRRFAELIETVESLGIDVIFAENTDTTVLAEQLASEVLGRADLELEVVRLYTDALGEPGSGAETYLGLLRTTGRLIADALR